MNEVIRPYPFTETVGEEVVDFAIGQNLDSLLKLPFFDNYNKDELRETFSTYYSFAKLYFREEEELRKEGKPGANLYYHGKPHAVFSAPYDAISVFKGILQRNDKFSAHLTCEGVLAGIGGTTFHDVGYVSDGPVENYAARTPIHVEESKTTFEATVRLLGLPKEIDTEKVIRLGKIGIHGTYFPFNPERLDELNKMLDGLTLEEKKEAQIVRLAVQLADLGGQCARPDYFPKLVMKLRDEMNEAQPDSGTKIIGENHELKKNCEFFLDTFVRHCNSPIKNVETVAIALLGEKESKPLRDAWYNTYL